MAGHLGGSNSRGRRLNAKLDEIPLFLLYGSRDCYQLPRFYFVGACAVWMVWLNVTIVIVTEAPPTGFLFDRFPKGKMYSSFIEYYGVLWLILYDTGDLWCNICSQRRILWVLRADYLQYHWNLSLLCPEMYIFKSKSPMCRISQRINSIKALKEPIKPYMKGCRVKWQKQLMCELQSGFYWQIFGDVLLKSLIYLFIYCCLATLTTFI